jgi:hypothetical protein
MTSLYIERLELHLEDLKNKFNSILDDFPNKLTTKLNDIEFAKYNAFCDYRLMMCIDECNTIEKLLKEEKHKTN